MATTASDIYVRSGASGSFTAVQFVQGGWITVPSASNMYSIYEDRLADGQIIYVQSQNQLYSVSKFIAFETPGYAGLENSASFSPFAFAATNTGSFAITGSNQFKASQSITGSLSITSGSFDITGVTNNIFIIRNSSSAAIMTVSQSGVIVLATQSSTPTGTAPNGAIAFTATDFFVGLD